MWVGVAMGASESKYVSLFHSKSVAEYVKIPGLQHGAPCRRTRAVFPGLALQTALYCTYDRKNNTAHTHTHINIGT